MPRTTPVSVKSSVIPSAPVRTSTALGNPEVGDLGVTVVLQEDVARFDVAMQHTELVGGHQCGERFGDDEQDSRCCQRPAGNLVAQRGPRQPFHDEVGQRVVLAVVQDGHDVGMDEPRREAGLLLEPLAHAGQGLRLRAEDLHGDRSLQAVVEGVEDAGHTAFAEQATDAVAAPDGPCRGARLHPCCVPLARGR